MNQDLDAVGVVLNGDGVVAIHLDVCQPACTPGFTGPREESPMVFEIALEGVVLPLKRL